MTYKIGHDEKHDPYGLTPAKLSIRRTPVNNVSDPFAVRPLSDDISRYLTQTFSAGNVEITPVPGAWQYNVSGATPPADDEWIKRQGNGLTQTGTSSWQFKVSHKNRADFLESISGKTGGRG